MSVTFKVACIQNCAGPDMDANLQAVDDLVRGSCSKGAKLICLPEYASCLNITDDGFAVGPYPEEAHPALSHIQNLADELDCWILLGSLAIEADNGKILNRSYMINDSGVITARYDKLHLFDVDLNDGESYRESKIIEPGDKAVLASTPWGPLGMSVCYDLRFAYLYRTLAQGGALFHAVPAAFAKTTGKAHWHVLLRSRAIETGSYIFAPCQTGFHGTGESYGHSLIIDPWGEILADAGEETGFIIANIDTARVKQARQMVPALLHDRSYTLVK
ncbi:MAG: carbon-nitrogen hydrolase family protein [Rhodospirillales bacterium]|nr:carbon-nitrogen hydrolase family protein [Rhodospirillales bacterium]MBT4085460.1 carbon-nitrogen hydrolase family protein [Alphaproteobacteria bacterium]MBT6240438.1 carbon-nitrogen hydrolase family protein [Rhodospirillaceae bacterium]